MSRKLSKVLALLALVSVLAVGCGEPVESGCNDTQAVLDATKNIQWENPEARAAVAEDIAEMGAWFNCEGYALVAED